MTLIGHLRSRIADELEPGLGQTVEPNKAGGEPVDVYINGRFFGRAAAVVVGDRCDVRITELVASGPR